MPAGELAADLELALALADRADARLLAGFGDPGAVEHKDDGTPVSSVDRETEAALRAVLAEARPGDAVLGEEAAAVRPGRRGAAGSSTRSTERRTTCAAARSSPA